MRPYAPPRDLTQEEQERYAQYHYVAFEAYDADDAPVLGRFLLQEDVLGCSEEEKRRVQAVRQRLVPQSVPQAGIDPRYWAPLPLSKLHTSGT